MALLNRYAHRAMLLLSLALHLSSCLREDVTEPVTETIAVHGILLAGSTTAGVAVARVSAGRPVPLSGAMLTLARPGGERALVQLGTSSSFCFGPEYESTDFQCYGAVLDTPIQPEEPVALDIVLPDGARLRGRTTAPQPPVIDAPAAGAAVHTVAHIERFGEFGFSMSFDPVEVRWSDAGDRPASVFLRVGELFADDESLPCVGFEPTHAFTRSPAHVFPPGPCSTQGDDVMWDSARVDVFVTTYDEAAAAYLVATDELGAGIVLDGASPGLDVVEGDVLLTGVFGSAASAFVPFTLHATVVEEEGAARAERFPQCDLRSQCRLRRQERDVRPTGNRSTGN